MGLVQSNESTITSINPTNYINITEAQLLIDKQQTLISNLRTAITNINSSLIVDAKTNKTQSTIPMQQLPTLQPTTIAQPTTTQLNTVIQGFRDMHEGFMVGSLPNNNIPELKDYVRAYNESIALLDDPNNLNQINFDTYIHIQDKKLEELNKLITDIQNLQEQNGGNRTKPIKAIRNLNTSTILNVEEYPDPQITNSNTPNYNGNGAVNYPNYVIYGNNGCLQYNKGTNDKNPSSYNFQPCNANNANQRFTMQQIKNKNDYNARISDPTKHINSDDSIIMGFYVVNPEVDTNHCITLNNNGLTVEPCNMLHPSQRFKPYYHSVNP